MINELINEIENLQSAKELLWRVYLSTSPYHHYSNDEQLQKEINNYFNFEDGA